MAHHTYKPDDAVCSTLIEFDIEEGVLKNLRVADGCDGNSKAVSRLCEGLKVDQAIRLLKGIECEDKGTSCADQLTKALEKALKG